MAARRDEPIVGTCEGCGLEVDEGTECPDCGAEIIWPDDLAKLAALHEKGLLTEDEFVAAKRRVLEDKK